MNRTYHCPKCHANLNPNIKIILMAETSGKRGLLLLSPQPGNYDLIGAEEIKLVPNALVDLFCPVCNESLTADNDESMAALEFDFSTERVGTVYFSRRYHHHATYFVFDDEVEAYGKNAAPHGMNYFGSGQSEE